MPGFFWYPWTSFTQSEIEETHPLQTYGKVDSKFRFVIVASKRAKQILKGSKVKIRTKSKNPIRIAQIEVKAGLVDYEILKSAHENLAEVEEQVLSVDAGIVEDAEEAGVDVAVDEVISEEVETEDVVGTDYDDELPDEPIGGDKEDE
ncbi:MAG: DNA-directed RNA polymerase subunit omega [Candidatus Aminicenantes bacterium]|nr:DNA-directed RNA polymerase subunit omega [Candidatus Aminicenantes bacterium]